MGFPKCESGLTTLGDLRGVPASAEGRSHGQQAAESGGDGTGDGTGRRLPGAAPLSPHRPQTGRHLVWTRGF